MVKQHNSIINKGLKKGLGLMLASICLIGCDSISTGYDDFIENSANEIDNSSQLTSVQADTSDEGSVMESSTDDFIDTRLVPEQSMVENALLAKEEITIDEQVFSLSQNFIQKQQAFEVSVDTINMFEVEEFDESLASEFNFSTDEGSIVLLHATITNTSDETFYFPIEELRLSYPGAIIQNYPSAQLYPMESGNLAQILLANSGEMAPQTAVEGYLVYGIGREETEEILDLGSFYLTVVPPRQSLNEIVGLGSNPLGDELPLYLPINDENGQQLLLNTTYIQDRLTTEWWGYKEIIASEDLNASISTDDDVKITLLRAEVSDFTPHKSYEDAFQYFNYGQVIVSIEYEVTNNSKNDLLPIDGRASLVINGDEISDDYVLINEMYGKTLKPGDSYKVVKTFALDKMTYADYWQGEDVYISINVPTVEDSTGESSETSETLSDEESVSEDLLAEEVLEESKIEYYADFVWSPSYQFFVDEAFELIPWSERENIQESEFDEDEEIDIDENSDEE